VTIVSELLKTIHASESFTQSGINEKNELSAKKESDLEVLQFSICCPGNNLLGDRFLGFCPGPPVTHDHGCHRLRGNRAVAPGSDGAARACGPVFMPNDCKKYSVAENDRKVISYYSLNSGGNV
jgi:hypothetical protein